MRGDDGQGLERRRIETLLYEEEHYRSTLNFYRRLSLICVVAGIVFPILAGSALLGSFSDDWKYVAGGLALTAAILTSLHKGLECEAYHARCKQAVHSVRGLIEGYEAALALAGKERALATATMEQRLKAFREAGIDVPPRR